MPAPTPAAMAFGKARALSAGSTKSFANSSRVDHARRADGEGAIAMSSAAPAKIQGHGRHLGGLVLGHPPNRDGGRQVARVPARSSSCATHHHVSPPVQLRLHDGLIEPAAHQQNRVVAGDGARDPAAGTGRTDRQPLGLPGSVLRINNSSTRSSRASDWRPRGGADPRAPTARSLPGRV